MYVKKPIISEIEKNRILLKHNSLNESFPQDEPTEERIAYIQKRLDHIQDIFPFIERYVETKWGNKVELRGSLRDIHYGHENYSGQKVVLEFYLEETNHFTCLDISNEIRDDIKNLFGLNVNMYGEPLELYFYKKKWEKI